MPSAPSRRRTWRKGAGGLLLAALLSGGLTAVPAQAAQTAPPGDPTSDVDLFVGTQDNASANGTESAYGDTTPGATTPFGMVNFNPNTYNTKGGSYTNQGGYEYDADQIRGFSLNRISGTGCAGHNGAEDFPIFPYTGQLADGVLPSNPAAGIKPYYADFSHDQESASPGSYKVTLGNGVTSELTATTRTADGRFTFPSAGSSGTLLFDTAGSLNGSSDSTVRVLGNDVIEGSTTVQATCKQGTAYNYTAYFHAKFDQPFTSAGTWQDGAMSAVPDLGAATDVSASSTAADGTGAFVGFAPGSKVTARIGLSYVSDADAAQNLAAEAGTKSFDTLRDQAHGTWRDTLRQVAVTSGKPTVAAREEQLTTFYTALYHSLLHPNVFDDVNGEYEGYDKKVHTVRPGHHEYTTYSGWDVYRDEAQLIGLLFPDRASDIDQSITDMATQVGVYNWPMLNAGQNKMDGDSLDSVLASLDAFGGTDYDRAGALAALKSAQTLVANDAPGAPSGGVPAANHRAGFYQYAALGFEPDSAGVQWPTSTSLEYAVDDFGIAQLAQSEGDSAAYDTFMGRAQSWQDLFDPGQNALAPRNKNGFDRGVSLTANTGQFSEASGAQYGWMVPQDIAGLVAKKGGTAQAEAQLDAFFANFAPGGPGSVNPGSNSPYAYMSNEIDSQDPELYDWIGRPDRTAEVNQEIRDALWTSNTPDGLYGNDDLGALSAWYVWSSLGVFPAVYGRSELAVSGPAFTSVQITSSGTGRHYAIKAPQQSDSAKYVTGLRVNGRATTATWLPESFAQHGGTLEFTMASKPGTWGTGAKDAPPSFSTGSDSYNNVGASPAGEGDLASFDVSNNSYQAGLLPKGGSTVSLPGSSVTYTWPDTAAGAPDNWVPHGQTVDMRGQRAGAISFLGAATNGPAAGTASVNYTDGTHQVVAIDLNDWTSPNLPAGANTTVLTTAHRNNANGTQDNTAANIYGTAPEALDSWKSIASVTLPTDTDQGVMHVFAVGTAPVAATALTASSALPAGSGTAFAADLADLSGGTATAPGGYRVSVDWGDHHTGAATVLALDDTGRYSAFGTHTYARRGTYRVTVRISDGTHTATTNGTVDVS